MYQSKLCPFHDFFSLRESPKPPILRHEGIVMLLLDDEKQARTFQFFHQFDS